MRQTYPVYKKGELEDIYKKLLDSDKQLISKYIDYCAISAGKNKLADMRRSIIQFRNVTGKQLDEITLQDLRDFLTLLNKSDRKNYTKNGIKTHVRKFLRWHYKDWSERFSELADINLVNGFNEEKINEGVLLHKEDIEKVMKAEKDLRRKTFFITLYETGLRPVELRNLKWKDIKFNIDGDISELHIFATKTGKARTTYVKESTFYLQKLMNYKDGELVFCARDNKNKPIAKQTACAWLDEMGKQALKRHIFPYILRHSRATELYASMPSKTAQKFLGHGKDMSDFYAHLSSKDVKEAVTKTVYKFEELPPEKREDYEKRIKALEFVISDINNKYKGMQEFLGAMSDALTSKLPPEVLAKIRERPILTRQEVIKRLKSLSKPA